MCESHDIGQALFERMEGVQILQYERDPIGEFMVTGTDRIIVVDKSDPNQPVFYTESGKKFKLRIIKEA